MYIFRRYSAIAGIPISSISPTEYIAEARQASGTTDAMAPYAAVFVPVLPIITASASLPT